MTSLGWNDGIIYCHSVRVLLICDSEGPPFQIIMNMMDMLCSWGQQGLRELRQSSKGDTSHKRVPYYIIAVGSCLKSAYCMSFIVCPALLVWLKTFKPLTFHFLLYTLDGNNTYKYRQHNMAKWLIGLPVVTEDIEAEEIILLTWINWLVDCCDFDVCEDCSVWTGSKVTLYCMGAHRQDLKS